MALIFPNWTRKIVLSVLITATILGCSGSLGLYLPEPQYPGFRPIDPIEYTRTVEVLDSSGQVKFKSTKLLTNEEVLKALINETVMVAVAKVSYDGSLSFGVSNISKNNTQYVVTMDYMKFTSVPIEEDTNVANAELKGVGRLGVGLRIRASLTSKSSNINLADLFSIGIAARNQKVFGALTVEIIGIQSREVTAAIPLPSEISTASIQAAMQAMATIKSKIHDTETILTPQIIAVKAEQQNIKTIELQQNLIETQKRLRMSLQ